jgi:hypothetical protein
MYRPRAVFAPDAFSERDWRLDQNKYKFAALYEETLPGSRVLKPGVVQPTKIKWADGSGQVHVTEMAQPLGASLVELLKYRKWEEMWSACYEWVMPETHEHVEINQKHFDFHLGDDRSMSRQEALDVYMVSMLSALNASEEFLRERQFYNIPETPEGSSDEERGEEAQKEWEAQKEAQKEWKAQKEAQEEAQEEAHKEWEAALKRHDASLHSELRRYRQQWLAEASAQLTHLTGPINVRRSLQGLYLFSN